MTSQAHPVKIISWILFVFFLALLTRNILFKKNLAYYKHYFRHEYRNYKISDGWKLANTKPFHTITLFYSSKRLTTEYKANNLLGNIIGFFPFGLLLPFLLLRFRNVLLTTFAGFILSLIYELAQLVFGLGVFDVDDLILNTAGCLSGYITFSICWWIYQGVEKKGAAAYASQK